MVITEKNQYGEKMHFKLEDGVVMVHHTDCTEDYVTLNDLILKFILNEFELLVIYNTCKKLYYPTVLEEVKKLKENYVGIFK
jgi:hypothetical protein